MPNYSVRVEWSPEDEVYLASCPEFDNLSAHGADPGQAVAELSEALQLAIESYEEEGWALPEARVTRRYSGQFRIRIPESLHAWLAETAEREGVSLNTLVVAKLSEARGALDTSWAASTHNESPVASAMK